MSPTPALDPDEPVDPEEFERILAEMSPEDFTEFLDGLPEPALAALLRDTASMDATTPSDPLAQAMELDPIYQARSHLEYLAARIAAAVERVRAGESVQIVVSMPPRSGKSYLISRALPVWLLRLWPSWKFALLSYSLQLATQWSRDVRRFIEAHGARLGLAIAPDAGAVQDWETTARGQVHARSMGMGITGFGANVLLIDDPIKDYATAHNARARDEVWEKWKTDISSRREPPSLTIVVGTRWHQDDFIGRLLSKEYEGNPDDWEVISFPAIAEENDVLGRAPGDPLLPPILPADRDVALKHWNSIKETVGSYGFAALYQQRPAPSTGAIFDVGWWRYWTTNPAIASRFDDPEDPRYGELDPDGKTILVDLPSLLAGSRLLDSWDLNFDDTENSDYVVGQRWAMLGLNRYLIDQRRGRWNFPRTLEVFEEWNSDKLVHQHLVEKKANGAAMIAMISRKFTGIKPVNPTQSKEVRARAVTAEIESGHVFLPHPTEYPWVMDLQGELREFPSGAHDDQVDALTQALMELRDDSMGGMSIPGLLGRPGAPAPTIRRSFGGSSGIGAGAPGAAPGVLGTRIGPRFSGR